MKRVGHTFLLAVIIALLSGAAGAETFFEWTDDVGVIHFTNIKAEVPTERLWAQVAVDAAPAASVAPEPDPPVPPPPAAGTGIYESPVAPEWNIGRPADTAYAGPDEYGPYSYGCDVPYVYPGGAVVHHGHAARHLGPPLAQPLVSGRMRSRGSSRGHR
jgi:hypothetical protein